MKPRVKYQPLDFTSNKKINLGDGHSRPATQIEERMKGGGGRTNKKIEATMIEKYEGDTNMK